MRLFDYETIRLTLHRRCSSQGWTGGNFPEFGRGRVLLPESFAWFRQIPDLPLRRPSLGLGTFVLDQRFGSLPCCPLNCVSILRLRGMRVKRMNILDSQRFPRSGRLWKSCCVRSYAALRGPRLGLAGGSSAGGVGESASGVGEVSWAGAGSRSGREAGAG